MEPAVSVRCSVSLLCKVWKYERGGREQTSQIKFCTLLRWKRLSIKMRLRKCWKWGFFFSHFSVINDLLKMDECTLLGLFVLISPPPLKKKKSSGLSHEHRWLKKNTRVHVIFFFFLKKFSEKCFKLWNQAVAWRTKQKKSQGFNLYFSIKISSNHLNSHMLEILTMPT